MQAGFPHTAYRIPVLWARFQRRSLFPRRGERPVPQLVLACHPVVGEALAEPVGVAILSPQLSAQPVAPKGLLFAKLLAGPNVRNRPPLRRTHRAADGKNQNQLHQSRTLATVRDTLLPKGLSGDLRAAGTMLATPAGVAKLASRPSAVTSIQRVTNGRLSWSAAFKAPQVTPFDINTKRRL